MKKLLSLALVVVMLFSMIPSTIFAKPMDAGAPTKSNVVDATISEGEYSWTSGQFDRNVNIANEVHVVTAYNADNVYNGGNKVLYSQIWMGYDEDYIYLAYRERGGYPSCVWLDLNPCIGLENSRSQLSLLVNGSTYGGSQHTAYDATDIIKIYAYSDVGVSVQEETSKYVVEAQKSFYDDGAMIVNTFEIKVSRAALAEYASRFNEGTTSFDKLGFRSFIQSDYTKTSAEVFYADNDSEYKAFGSHANRGFHVFDVSGNVSDETQTPETEPAETEPTETQPVETEPPAPVVDLKGYELTAYDQQLYFIGKDTSDKAYANSLDTIDGKIAVGEYTWSVTLDPKKDAEDKSFFRNGNPVDLVSMTINAVVHDGYLYLATVVEDTGNVNGWQDYVFGWLGYGEYTRHTTERFILPRAGSQIEFPSGNHTPDTIGSAGLSIDKFKVASVGDLTTYEWRYDLSKYENSNMLYFGLAYVTSDQFIKFGFETNDNLGQNSKLDNQARDMYPHVLFLGDKDDFSELGESFVNCTNHTYANGVFISDTEHRVVCTTCGTVDYLAHTLVPTGGTEPTYTQPGALTYACEAGLCGGKFDPQVPALGIPEDKHLLTLTEQKQFFVAKSTDDNSTTPVMNGVIDELEYNWSALDVEGFSNTANVTGVDVYFTYDDENVYVAIRVDDASEHVNYTTCARLYINGSENIDDAWNIYLTKANGTGVEHWQITDGASSINLWDPIDSKNSEAHKNGQGDKHYVFGQSYANGVYTYEISLNRAEWGLSGNKIFLGVRAIDRDNKDFIYGFKSDDLGTEPAILGAYPHVMFLGEKSAFADYLADTTLAYTPCENHAYGDVLVGENMHKQICTVCGAVNVAAHTFGEQTTTIAPSFGVAGYSYKTCTLDGCGATQIVAGSEQYFDPNANATGTTQYTLWQNNIMQNNIQENCYANTNHKDLDHDRNGDGVVDGKDEYFFLPSVTKDIWTKGTKNGRYQSFYATLEKNMPDIVALQECDYGWHVVIDTHGEIVDGKYGSYGANTVEEGYTFTYGGKSVTTYPIAKLGYASVFEGHATIDKLGVRSPIYYNTAVFELVEANIDLYNASGYYENAFVFAWAILKAKATGEYVAVTSTHLPADYSGKDSGLATRNSYVQNTILPKIEEFETVYNIPVISVGDWNADIYEDGMVALNNVMNTGRENALVGKNLSWMTSGNSLGARPYDSNNLPDTVYLGPNGDEVYRKSDDARIGSQIDHCFYSEAGIAGDEWEVRIDDNSYCDHVPALFTFRIVGVNHECEDVSAKAWTKLDDTKHYRKCVCNANYEEAEHNVTSYTQNADGVTHSGACADCGATVTLACTAANAEYTTTATTHSFTCSVCTGTVSADHNYKWTFTGTTADDTHTKTCDVCGYVAVNTAKHDFDDGVMTTPAKTNAFGVKTFTCECGAFYTKTWVTDGHFLSAFKHFFAGNELAAAPRVDGILNSAEYSWSSGLLATNNTSNNAWKTAGRVQWCIHANGCVNSIETFLGYDEDNIYVALVSYYDGTRPATEEVRVYLGGGESISRIVGFKGVFTNGKLTTDMQYFDMTGVYTEATGYTIKDDFASKDSALDALAEACFNGAAAKVTGNALVYEVVIDRDALAAACGADATLDRLYFQPAITGVNASGARNGWIASCVENRGSNTRKNLDNYMDFLYINGTFPNVMFLNTKVNESAYLADNAEHSGWNTPCTAHSYRLVYAGNDTHKNVCVLCGAEEAAVACTMSAWAFADNGVHAKTCSVCNYVAYEEHTLGEVTSGNNGTHSQTCSVCTGTVTNNCSGEWAKTETTHATTCTICDYTMPAEEHKFAYTTTGTLASGTHTGTCNVCGYVTAAEAHTAPATRVTKKPSLTVKGTIEEYCTVCNTAVSYEYAPDGHLLTAYECGQKHFFAGPKTTIAPATDGLVDPDEYIWKHGTITPKNITAFWNWKQTGVDGKNGSWVMSTASNVTEDIGLYFSYDDARLYLAFTQDNPTKFVSDGGSYKVHTVTFNLGAGENIKNRVTITAKWDPSTKKGSASVSGGLGTNDLGMQWAVTEVGNDTDGYRLTWEFRINRSKLATETGAANANFDKLYYGCSSNVLNAEGKRCGDMLVAFSNLDYRNAIGGVLSGKYNNHVIKSFNRLPQVMFLGSNEDFDDYLKNEGSETLGSFYQECTTHIWRTAVNSETTHIDICQVCGQTANEKTCEFKITEWLKPVTQSSAGLVRRTCSCDKALTYTFQYLDNGHFLRGMKHYFSGNAMGIAPKVDGILDSHEYSWTTGTLAKPAAQWPNSANGKWVSEGTTTEVANTYEVYFAYDSENVYVALTSKLDSGVAHLSNENAYLYIGGSDSISNILGIKLNYWDGKLTLTPSYYNVTTVGSYNYLITKYPASTDATDIANAAACVTDAKATLDTATNTIIYEVAISREALATLCGAEDVLDRLYFQPVFDSVRASDGKLGKPVGLGYEYRGSNYVWDNVACDYRGNGVGNAKEFLYINGTFPMTMFLSTQTAQANYLGNNEYHNGWYTACTSHKTRLVYGDATNHKNVCYVCGYETLEAHVYDNTCDTTCNTCGFVREITHTEGAAATCTTAQTCTVCGVELAPALGHTTLVEKAAAVPATCTVDGKTAIMGCERCDALNEGGETITAAGHKYDGELDADCNVCGETRDVTCTHSYNKEVTDPTCTTDGYTTYTCSKCGDTYKDDEVVAAGHKYDAKVTDPTCEAEGYTTHTCSVCGDSYVDTKVDATGHNYNKVVTDPTCTADGYTTNTCTVCGDTYTDGKVDATGHKDGELTNNGENHTITCSVCGATYGADHKYEYEAVTLVAAYSIKHTGTCACSATVTEDHNGMTITPATKTAVGYIQVNCDKCGFTQAKDKYHTDGHFLWAEGMRHLFLGGVQGVTPELDGKVESGEYTWKSADVLPTAWAWNAADDYGRWIGGQGLADWQATVTLYAGYDADYIYIAGKSVADPTDVRPAEQSANFILGGSYESDKNVQFNIKYMTATGEVVISCSYFDAGTENKSLATAARACMTGYKVVHDKETNTITYEIKVSRAALAEMCGEDENLNKLYFSASLPQFDSKGVNGATYFIAAYYNYTTKNIGNQYYVSGRFPHVMFLGEKDEFKTYLQTPDDPYLGDFYTGCSAHDYRYVYASDTAHKQICRLCGADTAVENHVFDNTCDTTCNTCGYVREITHTWADADCDTPKTCSVCGATEGTALGHTWADATCTDPKTCETCGETEGEALGHTWADATCTAPKTCETCGATEGEALGHDWADADCDTPKTCKICGATEGEALGHDWADADCDTPKTCKTCGETEGEALGHNEVAIPAVDATCTAEGATAGVKCDRCNEVLKAPVATPKAEHTYDDQYDADCNECGFVREAVEVAAMIGEKKFATVKDAFDAAVEGDTIVVLTRIVVDGNETWDLTGKTLDIQYTMNNYVVLVKGNLTIKGGTFNIANAYGIGVQPNATLVIDGGSFTTTAENYLIGSWGTTTINGGEFNAVYCNVNGFAGTLTINGGEFTIGGYTGEYDALDVLAGDGVATIFGGSFSTDISEYIAKGYIATVVDGRYIVAACTHQNKTTTETDRVEADCTTDGSYVEIVTCDDCGNELSRETKTIDAKGHRYGNLQVFTFCLEEGYITIACGNCGAAFDSRTDVEAQDYLVEHPFFNLAAKGHTELVEKEAAVPATCTTAGKTAVMGCERCEYTEGGAAIDALGHEYDEQVTAPTCMAGGYTTYTCTRCSDSYTGNATDIVGHNIVVTDAGYSECSFGCGRIEVSNEAGLRAAIAKGGEFFVTADIAVDADNTIMVNGTSVMNLGEYVITGVSNEATANRNVFDVRGTLTVNGGTITIEHVGTDMAWNNSTNVFNVTAGGVLNVYDATIKNLGGSSMAFCVHLNNWGEVTLNAERTAFESSYIAIRVFNSGYDMNNVTLKDCDVKGAVLAFWVHNYTVVDFGTEERAEQAKALLNLDIFNGTNNFTGKDTKPTPICYGFTDEVYFDVNGDHVHVYAEEVTDPTCTAEGYTTYTCNCGDSYVGNKVDALEHEAGAAATCTTAQTCIRCDYVFVEALGHDWADADCDTPKTCKVCGETEGTALGHNMQKTAAAVLPSCEAAGKTEVYTCANGCGKTEGGDPIDALGHNMQETEAAVAPKCEEAGKTAVLTCANGCGKTEGGEVVPETGHSEITVPAVDATCTATGLTEGKKCKNCGVITVEQDVVPTIAHTEQTVPAVDPTCSQTGLTEGTICSVCKTVIKAQETVKKLAHDYNTAVNVGDGLHRFTCEACGVTRTEKHNFNTENVCAECNAKPETVFDLGGVGQKHDYVGAPVEEENKPDIANDETFDASKYTEIAKVESEEMEEATDKKNDYFFWSETMQIGHFKVYITYDADKIYIAAEVDTNAHANTDHMTFNLRTLKGLAKVKLGADKALVDEKNVVAVSNVFTSDNGNGGHVVVYAIEVNRDALADVITMADGEGTDNQLGLSAEYTNTTGTATFGAISDNTVTDAEGNNIISEGEVVPMLLTLSTEDDSSDTITGDGDSTSIDVSGVYNETEAEKIISVSLEWTVPTFTYTAQYKWNTTEFENELDTENSGWSTEPATIIIKNHSNQEISASFAFTQVVDSNVKNVNGKFTESNDVNANAITNVLVDSAEPVEGEIKGEEKTATVYFFITEGTLAEGYDNRIGNITITIGAGNSN